MFDRLGDKRMPGQEQGSLRHGRGCCNRPWVGMVRAAAACAGLVLCGCSAVQRLNDSKLTLESPVDWWHDLQGGRIAQDRPPPPGADDPYPNLAAVPARPTPTDAVTRRALSAQLAEERDRTQRAAARDPIMPASAPAALAAAKAAGTPPAAAASPAAGAAVAPGAAPGAGSPAGAGSAVARAGAARAAPAPPVPDDEPSKAVLDAAEAPPPPPARRGRGAGPGMVAGGAGTAPGGSGASPGDAGARPAGAALASGPLPELPAGAPPIPRLPGLPATTFAPPTPKALPQAVIAFSRGSAALPDSADPALRALAGLRAGGGVVVQAGGDADGAGPAQQAAAVPLGLARAGAIRGALLAAGVPASAIRTEASGLGRTGSARLLP